MNRVLEISNPAHLRCLHGCLVVEPRAETKDTPAPPPVTLTTEDAGIIVLNHPAITITAGFLQACVAGKVPVLVCDERHLPRGLLLDPQSASLHGRVVRAQAVISLPARKRAWQQIIRAKITAQHETLVRLVGKSHLGPLRDQVRSGDPDNIEARAARIYWPALFGPEFSRDTNALGANALLNYGYAVLRAAVARALASAGMHPALGLWHHNQYNAFALADDIIEPLRPLTDRAVWQLLRDGHTEVARPAKATLLSLLEAPVRMDGGTYPLPVALERCAASLARFFENETRDDGTAPDEAARPLRLPEVC